MNIKFITMAALLLSPLTNMAQTDNLPYQKGKFVPSEESLMQYQCPEWFRDAKFGIWSHWGPQAVPRQGDKYARRLYMESDKQGLDAAGRSNAYLYHIEHYGHPSKVGYKDIIPLWKADRWNPEALMKLYKKVGAKYFVSMAIHHDNFSLWNTKLNRWNSVEMGPKKDVVGLWQAAAKKEGLYFGVSEHLGRSYTWYQIAHSADKKGPFAGIPYDANDPQYVDLYHEKGDPSDDKWLTVNPKWQRDWFNRIKELQDIYRPDLLYSDSEFPFGVFGRTMLANLYNLGVDKKGVTQTVYTCKHDALGMCVLDVERGAVSDIHPVPWQTDTSIGDWYYNTGQKYMTGKEVIQMLVDVVSKNGNLLLNIVQTPEGDLEPDVLQILDVIAEWIADNGEAIYGSRPWVVYGEGPSTIDLIKGSYGGVKDVRPYTQGDLRFTTRNGKLYVFCMEQPEVDIKVTSLAGTTYGTVTSVKMLGSKQKLQWSQGAEGLTIKKPVSLPDYATTVYEITFKK